MRTWRIVRDRQSMMRWRGQVVRLRGLVMLRRMLAMRLPGRCEMLAGQCAASPVSVIVRLEHPRLVRFAPLEVAWMSLMRRG